MLVEALLVISITLTIAYIVLYVIGGTSSYQGENAVYSLSKSNTKVLDSSFLPWDSKACALRFGIFVSAAPKTLEKVDCLDSSPPVTSFAPSCNDYEFKMCACNTTDCTRCSLQSTYLSRLLNLSDVFELWASGYTNQNDKPFVPAILKIKTIRDPSSHFVESVSLPAIPLQKWTFITVVKEGRRIDVYYGSNLVVSKLLTYLPASPPSQMNWYAGNSMWNGQIGFFHGFIGSHSSSQVNSDMKSILNTRGIPNYLDQIKFNISDFELSDCILGSCNILPKVKPKNPFLVYSSSVA